MKQPIKYASISRRFFSNLIDGLILSGIGIGINLTLSQNPFTLSSNPNGLEVLDYVITLIVSMLYMILFWVKYEGQTPGKRALHIKIIKENGDQIDFTTALIRYVSYLLSTVVCYLGYIWAIFDSKKQTWHDKIARTLVVESDDKKPHKIIYVVGCIFPLLFIIIMGFLFSIGFVSALQEKNSPVNKALNKTKSAVDNMNPEVKTHWDKSQELFKQMRELQSSESEPENTLLSKTKALNDENIEELKKALELDPSNARIWIELGHAYTWISTRGTLADSSLAYKKAVELEPDNAIYNNSYGDSLIKLGKYEEAVLVLKKSVRLSNDSNYAHQSLATAYEYLNLYNEAKSEYQTALNGFSKENENGSFDDEILAIQKALQRIQK